MVGGSSARLPLINSPAGTVGAGVSAVNRHLKAVFRSCGSLAGRPWERFRLSPSGTGRMDSTGVVDCWWGKAGGISSPVFLNGELPPVGFLSPGVCGRHHFAARSRRDPGPLLGDRMIGGGAESGSELLFFARMAGPFLQWTELSPVVGRCGGFRGRQ